MYITIPESNHNTEIKPKNVIKNPPKEPKYFPLWIGRSRFLKPSPRSVFPAA